MGGKVSKQYLEHVDGDWLVEHSEEVQLGSVLRVTDEYLQNALNSFEAVGSLLCLECWQRFAQEGRSERSSTLVEHQYGCLVERRWLVAEALGSWAITKGDITQVCALVARINRWLAIKRQGRWPDIEQEVTSFDCSVLDPRYIVATHALRDNLDSLFSVLPKAGI